MLVLKRKNSKKQGDVGLSLAIAWFGFNDYTVCIPLTDSQDYDLVVEKNGSMQRVQVKATTVAARNGEKPVVGLRVLGGNRTRQNVKHFDPGSVELLFVVTSNHGLYLIPSSEIASRSQLTLEEKYRIRSIDLA